MLLREALMSQGPSLMLQRAAQVEIARLDSHIKTLEGEAKRPIELFSLQELLVAAREKLSKMEDINIINISLLKSTIYLMEQVVVNREAENHE